MGVDVHETEDPGIRVVALTGRVDAFTIPELRQPIEALFDAGIVRMVIDLSGVAFLDSAGMALLVKVLKLARAQDGDVALVWSQIEAANRVLKLTKFDRVFCTGDDVNAALACLTT